jgi:hypothetical protein
MQTGIHTTLGSSPGNLIFNRDMFLNIRLIVDWHAITQKREHLINENLMSENCKHKRYNYDVFLHSILFLLYLLRMSYKY